MIAYIYAGPVMPHIYPGAVRFVPNDEIIDSKNWLRAKWLDEPKDLAVDATSMAQELRVMIGMIFGIEHALDDCRVDIARRKIAQLKCDMSEIIGQMTSKEPKNDQAT